MLKTWINRSTIFLKLTYVFAVNTDNKTHLKNVVFGVYGKLDKGLKILVNLTSDGTNTRNHISSLLCAK